MSTTGKSRTNAPADLLPCPFCAGTDLEIFNTHTPSFSVRCNDCDAEASGDYFPTPDGTVREDWFHYSPTPDDSGFEATFDDLHPEYKEAFRSAVSAWNRRAASQLTAAARDVLAERRRQVEVEGFTPERDDQFYQDGVLAAAAGSYALHAHDRRIDTTPARWPWIHAWWKPGTPRQMLVKAGALILAAIEQIDRRAAK